MSHFTVLVVGDNHEKQLEPFHEFECTGENNEYVQDIDETEETRQAYETGTMRRLTDGEGNYFSPYSDDYYRDPTPEELEKIGPLGGSGIAKGIQYSSRDWNDGKGYRAKIKYIPENLTEVEVPTKEIMTFEEYVLDYEDYEKVAFSEQPDINGDHKYRYATVNEDGTIDKVIRRTNPNRKWDWYVLGGRWNGFFKLKSNGAKGGDLTKEQIKELAAEYGTTEKYILVLESLLKNDPERVHDYTMEHPVAGGYYLQKKIQELITPQYEDAVAGSPGTFGGIAKAGYVDQAKKGDIDFAGMKQEAYDKAFERYKKVEKLLGGIPQLQFLWKRDFIDGQFKDLDIDEKRSKYHGQAAKQLVNEARKEDGLSRDDQSLLTWLDLEDYQCSAEEYAQNAANRSISTFAVLKDGKWYEKGEMGWWGMASNEDDQDTWNKKFNELIKDLPDNTVLSLVDCHI